ncbi:hypothetical protein ACIGKQ_17095 [Gordonia sp. NPDC062954]
MSLDLGMFTGVEDPITLLALFNNVFTGTFQTIFFTTPAPYLF